MKNDLKKQLNKYIKKLKEIKGKIRFIEFHELFDNKTIEMRIKIDL